MTAPKTSVSAKQLGRLTGASRFQLHRLVEAQIIPEPVITTGPKGRGRQRRWPTTVIPRVKDALRALDAGESLEGVRADYYRFQAEHNVAAIKVAAATARVFHHPESGA